MVKLSLGGAETKWFFLISLPLIQGQETVAAMSSIKRSSHVWRHRTDLGGNPPETLHFWLLFFPDVFGSSPLLP